VNDISGSDSVHPDSVTETMMQASYATVALHQRLSLDQIAEGAAMRHFPMRDRATPEWFAAAAGKSSSLDEIAPELQLSGSDGDVDWDLIRMYAPELQQSELERNEGQGGIPVLPVSEVPLRNDRDIRINLLAELRDLDD